MKSSYRGVSWHRSCKKWFVKIQHNGKIYRVGYFENEIDAAKAYDKKSLELKKDKAKLNFNHYEHVCEIGGCNKLAKYKYKDSQWLCNKHVNQMNQNGKILNRTIFDSNEIVFGKEYSEIILYNKSKIECARGIIDTKNIDKVKDYKWYLRPDGYIATNNYNGEYKYLHEVLLMSSKSYVDHRDRNKLNNTEGNLRSADGSENGMNKGIRSNNTSGKVGVHWSKQNNKWCAMICYRKKHINLGYFDNLNDAIECRIEAEKKYFKSFKPINEKGSSLNEHQNT